MLFHAFCGESFAVNKPHEKTRTNTMCWSVSQHIQSPLQFVWQPQAPFVPSEGVYL